MFVLAELVGPPKHARLTIQARIVTVIGLVLGADHRYSSHGQKRPRDTPGLHLGAPNIFRARGAVLGQIGPVSALILLRHRVAEILGSVSAFELRPVLQPVLVLSCERFER